MNLCTNAKQAINGGYGKIVVNLKVVHVDQENYKLLSLLKKPGDYVSLEVRDNGCGMSAELQERIFEPFFTTKAKEQGTGLGLSVVHGIVKTHGGEIDVSSSIGRGTSFHIYFPVQEDLTDDEPETNEFEQMGSGRIMVVDDEMAIAQMLKKMLQRLGYSITIFTDSIEAVSRFRRNPDAFDLVLTDMTMPKMTGAELTREVLSLRPKLPVIMITGFSEIIDKDKAQRMGVKEFILKPVKKEKLSQVVNRVLGHG
jgi:CheY-like chemotaxis protein